MPTEEDEMKEVDTTLINADMVAELKSAARNVGGTYELRSVEKEVEVVEVQPDRNEILEGERAGEEVFRSIFGDDSDDD